MENIKWVGLNYKKNFSKSFEISTNGDIRNINSGKIAKMDRVNTKVFSIIFFENKSYRINIGEAQLESGLERTIFDLDIKEHTGFTRTQENYLDEMYGNKIKTLENALDELQDIIELYKFYKKGL